MDSILAATDHSRYFVLKAIKTAQLGINFDVDKEYTQKQKQVPRAAKARYLKLEAKALTFATSTTTLQAWADLSIELWAEKLNDFFPGLHMTTKRLR